MRVSITNLHGLVVDEEEEEHNWRTGVAPFLTSLKVKKSLALRLFS